MLSLLAAANAAQPLQWSSLGLTPGIELGFFTLRWYSLAYLAGLVLAYLHLSKMIKAPGAPMAHRHAEDLFFYCTLGVILGGRLGYALFYDPALFTTSRDGIWSLLRLWDGGMSFHGGVMGVMIATLWVCFRNGLPFVRVMDYIAVNVPFGMFFGRLANFVNGELWGRTTDVPWAMTFCDIEHTAHSCVSSYVARHPSQLYQAGLEGLVLMIVMLTLFWRTSARFRPGMLVGVFTLGMGAARFINEFFREPDVQLKWLVDMTGLSMGQWLSIPLVLVGIVLIAYARRRPPLATGTATAAG